MPTFTKNRSDYGDFGITSDFHAKKKPPTMATLATFENASD